MTRIIMHGCNGHMGQVITGIVANDANAQIVAGIDLRDDGHNSYPVFASLEECNVEADVIISHQLRQRIHLLTILRKLRFRL